MGGALVGRAGWQAVNRAASLPRLSHLISLINRFFSEQRRGTREKRGWRAKTLPHSIKRTGAWQTNGEPGGLFNACAYLLAAGL